MDEAHVIPFLLNDLCFSLSGVGQCLELCEDAGVKLW